ncbi:hypothetical protein NDU88_004100 [Pleurodeles waltl]|uniref:Uncharacterized protein n=1 Tax=Pleurodeles waltl TaxID=8319 RepID=A0AAV7LHD2_PLEWA|nr:hypothetical protein NDU88_004100 [Pleurodeles waltl]
MANALTLDRKRGSTLVVDAQTNNSERKERRKVRESEKDGVGEPAESIMEIWELELEARQNCEFQRDKKPSEQNSKLQGPEQMEETRDIQELWPSEGTGIQRESEQTADRLGSQKERDAEVSSGPTQKASHGHRQQSNFELLHVLKWWQK